MHAGQIYIPVVNTLLGFAVVALVALFRRSDHLANAYGLAVCGAMLCDSLLLFSVFRSLWRWPLLLGVALASLFVAIDLVFGTSGSKCVFPFVVASYLVCRSAVKDPIRRLDLPADCRRRLALS